jgi:hypothetical protein
MLIKIDYDYIIIKSLYYYQSYVVICNPQNNNRPYRSFRRFHTAGNFPHGALAAYMYSPLKIIENIPITNMKTTERTIPDTMLAKGIRHPMYINQSFFLIMQIIR